MSSTLHLLPSFLATAWLITAAHRFWNQDPTLRFGWSVPILALFLFHDAWPHRPPVACRLSIGPILLALAAATLLFLTQLYQAAYGITPASMTGLTLGSLGIVATNLWILFGPAGVRRLLFPFAFLTVAVPVPSALAHPVTGFLQELMASVCVEMLAWTGIPADRTGHLIQLPGVTVGLDEACSGIRSLQATLMMVLFIGALLLNNWRSRTMLLAIGVTLALTGNLMRSFYLSHTAYHSGAPGVDAAHDAAGWVVLLGSLSLLAATAFVLHRLEQRSPLAFARPLQGLPAATTGSTRAPADSP